MDTFDRHEANEFAKAAAAVGQEYLDLRAKVLSEGAALGLPLVDGEGLSALIQMGLKARMKLTEANGKVYEDERGRILELSDFNLKLIVENAKLTMMVFRNALKRYEAAVEHQLREQEIDNELLVEIEETGMAALRLLQIQVREALQQYENDIKAQVLALKLLLDEGKIDLDLLIHLTRLTITELAEVALAQNEVIDVNNILLVELANIQQAVTDVSSGQVVTVKKGAHTITTINTDNVESKWLGKLSD